MGISTKASSNNMVPTMSDLTLTIWYDHKWHYAFNAGTSSFSNDVLGKSIMQSSNIIRLTLYLITSAINDLMLGSSVFY